MNRLEGRIWFDPGFPSLTVPYHDTNDFFFSGHLGITTIYLMEYHVQGYRCLTAFCVVLAIYMWIFLTSMRVHYVIDLVTGVLFAHWAFIQADWASYMTDVKLFGLSHQERKQYIHKACKKCGWSNQDASQYICKDEIKFLKNTYRNRSKSE